MHKTNAADITRQMEREAAIDDLMAMYSFEEEEGESFEAVEARMLARLPRENGNERR